MASCFAGMIREIAEASLDCKKRRELEALMKNGVRRNDKTGLDFFTGYEYATLYDWDQYFEGLVQLYMGWGTGYMRNAVKVFMEHQQENGFTKRAINNSALVGIPSEEDHAGSCDVCSTCWRSQVISSVISKISLCRLLLTDYLKHDALLPPYE